jgi:hypothetical protein
MRGFGLLPGRLDLAGMTLPMPVQLSLLPPPVLISLVHVCFLLVIPATISPYNYERLGQRAWHRGATNPSFCDT